jgi:hypothetical protein
MFRANYKGIPSADKVFLDEGSDTASLFVVLQADDPRDFFRFCNQAASDPDVISPAVA